VNYVRRIVGAIADGLRYEEVELSIFPSFVIGLKSLFRASVAFCFVLLPFALDVPGAEALVERIIPREMAVLNKATVLVSTWNEMYFLVVAHL
jgi:hypothetical protein